jgi:alpha-ketoglutarate-dependent 2,4-dichlorophenoxyacetate dioxygenase
MAITIASLTPSFAAEARGVDLRNPISASYQGVLQAAFDEHGVLVLPGQDIDDDQQSAYSKGFGDLETSIRYNTDDRSGRPELSYIGNVDTKRKFTPSGINGPSPARNAGIRTVPLNPYQPTPPSCPRASSRPRGGGGTEFADLRGAWNTLPPDMQQRAGGLVVEHDIIKSRQKAVTRMSMKTSKNACRRHIKPWFDLTQRMAARRCILVRTPPKSSDGPRRK